MKHLALLTATAVIALAPAMAHADNNKGRDSHLETYNRVNMSDRADASRRSGDMGADMVLDVDNTESAYVKTSSNKAYSFPIKEGERIQIKGESIYLISASGVKAFAPNGEYTAPNGVTFVALNGTVERTEAPDQTAYVYTDDGLDVDVKDNRRK